jgi:hypothetical protein
MKSKLSATILLTMALASANAQETTPQGITQGKTPTGQPKFPLEEYTELPQLKAPVAEEWKGVKKPMASWGDIDFRYEKHAVPMHSVTSTAKIKGWKGEHVSMQAVVWTPTELAGLTYQLTDLKKGKATISATEAETGFVRYVMGDGLYSETTGCGRRKDLTKFDSVMVADCIDHYLKSTELAPMSAQGIWITCKIPYDAEAGRYIGNLIIKDGEKQISKLKVELTVEDKVLPQPKDWKFHLDLWQNPFAVARYHQVPLWSQEHFDAMRPIMTRLAQAGQKVITASIMDKPWNGQTEDPFKSMVTWIKKLDGSWEYKFDVFDKWVEFMMDCGITQQIDCYSMVPWRLSFRYFDQATDSFMELAATPGDQAFEDHWMPMLKAFAAHLKEKGWFDICTIAMDERKMEMMQETIKVIRKADKDFKIAFAGHYHPEIIDEIYDYCLAWRKEYPEGVIEKRRAAGLKTTYYTCCSEPKPNTFTFSEPAEAFQLAFDMLERGADGYLRWAYNSWPLEPLLDSRFRTWSSGDTYIVYPGNRTSIRFERFRDGIEEFEKVKSLGNL